MVSSERNSIVIFFYSLLYYVAYAMVFALNLWVVRPPTSRHVAFYISLFLFLIWFWTTIGATTTQTVIKICRTQIIGMNDYAGLTRRLLVLSAWINEWRATPGRDRRDKFVEAKNWDIRPRAFCQFVSLVSAVGRGIMATENTAYLLRRSCQNPFIILFVCVCCENTVHFSSAAKSNIEHRRTPIFILSTRLMSKLGLRKPIRGLMANFHWTGDRRWQI